MSDEAQSISSDDGELSDNEEEIKDKIEKEGGVKNGVKSESEKEEGELEEGELESDSEDEIQLKNNECPRIVALSESTEAKPLVDNNAIGLCRFYQRGACNWGDNCKYRHIKDSNWQQKRTRNDSVRDGRHSVFVSGDQPVPLLSVNTSMPKNDWKTGEIKRMSSARREVLEDTSDRHKDHSRHKRRHSSSSHSRSPRRSTDREIPSLFDVLPKYSKDSKSHNIYVRDRKHSHRSSRSPQTDSSRRKHNSGSTTSSRYVASASNREPIGKRSDSALKRHNSSKRDKDYEKMSKRVDSKSERHSKDKSDRHSSKKARRHSSRSGSTSPIGFRTKNPTNKQIEDFFAERDDEKPAAYRMDVDSSPESKRRKKRSSSSSSSSSSTSSSSSASSGSGSSSASSVSSNVKHKNSSKTSKSIQSAQAISDDFDADKKSKKKSNAAMNPEQISSSDEEGDANNGKTIEPQRISSSEGEEDKKIEPEQISSSSGEEEEQPKITKVEKRKKEKAHEDAVLGMDIGDVLEEFESRTNGAQSPLTSSG